MMSACFMEVVMYFIAKITDDIVLMVFVKVFSNQKPCVNRSVHKALNDRTANYKTGLITCDISTYKADLYNL